MVASRGQIAVLVCAAALLLGLHALAFSDYVVDDAYISFRYAQNLIAGHGLVFNPGERVEGYTNFLWTLALAAAMALGGDPRATAQALGMAAAIATVIATARLSRQLAPLRGWRYLALSPALLAGCVAFAYWSVAGLETTAFAAATAWAISAWLDARGGASYVRPALLLLLASLIRPEGLLLFGLVAALEAFDLRRRGRPRPSALTGLLSFVIPFALYFAWRWSYYGELLPNTFHAKVSGGIGALERGLTYTAKFLKLFPLFALAPLALSARRDRARPFGHRGAARLLLVVAGFVLYTIAVGGDAMPLARFFVPLLALLAPLVAEVIDRAGGFLAARRPTLGPSRVRLALGATALILTLAPSLVGEHLLNVVIAGRVADLGLATGAYLRSRYAPGTWIATNTAGAIPFASGLPAIDMLGLNDAHIARRSIAGPTKGWSGHEKGDGAYVLARRPKVILFANTTGADQPFYLSDHELAADPLFRSLYRLRSVPGSKLIREGPFRVLRTVPGRYALLGREADTVFDLGIAIQQVPEHSSTRIYANPFRLYYFELDPAGRAELERLLIDGSAPPPELPAPSPARSGRAAALALCERARFGIQQGRYAEAAAVLWRAAKLDPESALPFQYLSNLHFLQDDPVRAAWALWWALEREPRNPLYLRNLTALRRSTAVP
jgi:hypothetical protein